MSKITSADCVQEIIKLCGNPLKVLYAFCGGSDETYQNPEDLKEALESMFEDRMDEDPIVLLAELTNIVTNPKNWKRRTKQKDYRDPTITERVFDCGPFDDQLRAYVFEQGGKIIEAYIQGE